MIQFLSYKCTNYNEIEPKEIFGKAFFDALRISTRNDNIDETLYDNVKDNIDNSLICSNNDISKSNLFTCYKCQKKFTRKDNLKVHKRNCDGLDIQDNVKYV